MQGRVSIGYHNISNKSNIEFRFQILKNWKILSLQSGVNPLSLNSRHDIKTITHRAKLRIVCFHWTIIKKFSFFFWNALFFRNIFYFGDKEVKSIKLCMFFKVEISFRKKSSLIFKNLILADVLYYKNHKYWWLTAVIHGKWTRSRGSFDLEDSK